MQETAQCRLVQHLPDNLQVAEDKLFLWKKEPRRLSSLGFQFRIPTQNETLSQKMSKVVEYQPILFSSLRQKVIVVIGRKRDSILSFVPAHLTDK